MSVLSIDWITGDGDNTLALDWPGISEDSVIWEIGGYEGRWAEQMSKKYNPTIHIFEPQDWACDRMREKFTANPKLKIHQFALWTHTDEMELADYEHDGASLTKQNIGKTSTVQTVDAFSFFLDTCPSGIDVCLMNIEGGEYILLPYMIGMGMMRSIKYFWMQWHLYYQQSDFRMKAIHEMMAVTHDLYWDCGSTAQAWRIKCKSS